MHKVIFKTKAIIPGATGSPRKEPKWGPGLPKGRERTQVPGLFLHLIFALG